MSEIFKELEEVLNRNWEELMKLPHALNTGVSTKFIGGIDTKIPCIALFVDRKVPKDPEEAKKLGLEPLKPEHIAPQKLEGMPVDVVELSTKDYVLGETSVSRLPPDVQRRLMGAKRKPQQAIPKALDGIRAILKTPATGPDWSPWASSIQDQGSCGSCMSESTTGVMEPVIRIAANDMGAVDLLSVRDLFLSSGASCERGATPDQILNQAMNGVALESDCPYNGMAEGSDAPCVKPSDWWTRGKRIKEWIQKSGIAQIKSALLEGPLVATMEVHQSFLNYKGGGPYHNLGFQDPVLGGHGVGIFRYDDTLGGGAFSLRNSWGTGWGKPDKPGWADILYGEMDSTMYQLTPDGPIPEPPPGPTPSPCPFSMAVVKLPGGKWFLRHYRAIRKNLFGTEPGVYP